MQPPTMESTTDFGADADRSYQDGNATDPEWEHSAVQDETQECLMNCRNGGMCELGRPLHGFAAELLEDEGASHNSSMHCVCDTGWTGIHCEIKLSECENDECWNGERCQLSEDDFGMPFRHCECDALQTNFELPYVAHFCGQISNVWCSDTPSQSTSHSFCKNGGKCLAMIRKSHEA